MQDALRPFDYELPEACIAKHPPARREDARLLHVSESGTIADRGVTDLVSLLPEGSGVWVNETKVLHAFRRRFTSSAPPSLPPVRRPAVGEGERGCAELAARR